MYRVPKCHSCGRRKPKRPGVLTIWRVDRWMMNRDTGAKGQGCNCNGYPFQHRKKSLYCKHHPHAEKTLRETDGFAARRRYGRRAA